MPPSFGPLYVNVKDHGALGNGEENDFAAAQAALAEAYAAWQATGCRPVVSFPAGVYRFDVGLWFDHATEFMLKGDVHIRGDGVGTTTFLFVPATMPTNGRWFYGFRCHAGSNVEISDCTICPGMGVEGWVVRTWADLHDDESGTHGAGSAVHHEGISGDLTLRRVALRGRGYKTLDTWSSGYEHEAGHGTTTVEDCTFDVINVGGASWGAGDGKTYDRRIELARNRYHSIRKNHSIYRHGVCALRARDEYHGPSHEYPDAGPRVAYYVSGAAPETDSRPPLYVDISGAIVINDWGTPIRTKLSQEVEDDDAILLARPTTVAGEAGVAADGVRGGQRFEARRVTVTLAKSCGSYIPDEAVTIYYHEPSITSDEVIHSEEIRIADADGGTTLRSNALVARVLRVDLPKCQDANGSIRVGLEIGPQRVHRISNCQFLGCAGGIEAKVPMLVSGCVWDSWGDTPGSGGIRLEDGSTFTEILVTSCIFRSTEKILSVDTVAAHKGSRWDIVGCSFEQIGGTTPMFDSQIPNVDDADHELVFSHCTIRYSGGRQYGGIGNGSIRFRDCTFEGRYLENRFWVLDPDWARSPVIEFTRCSAPPGLRLLQSASMSVKPTLLGGDNAVLAGGNSTFHLPPGAVAAMLPRPGLAPHETASASVVVLHDWAYDTHKISGTATIDTLWFGDDAYKGMAGRIHLIATGTWSMSEAGNIHPKTLSARTPNQLYAFQYDASTNKWHEL